MRTGKKVSKENKFVRCMKGPFRVLARALTSGLTGNMMYGNAMGCPTPQAPDRTPVRSFSANSSPAHPYMSKEEDFRDLIRAASARAAAQKKINGPDDDLLRSRSAKPSPIGGGPRSSGGVMFGRIDEDEPCEFGDDVGLMADVYPRSQSCAVPRRSKMMA